MADAPRRRGTRWLRVINVDPEAVGAPPAPQSWGEVIGRRQEAEDIESRPWWKPMHLQRVFADCEVVGGALAEDLFEHGRCLPSGTAMSDADQMRVVEGIRAKYRTRMHTGFAHR